MIGLARVMRGRLQRAHAHLDAVVGGEAFRDQRRQQNVGLSELFDDLRFHGRTRREIDLACMPRAYDSFIALDHS